MKKVLSLLSLLTVVVMGMYAQNAEDEGSVVIDMSGAVTADDGFLKTFCSTVDLDFSAVDGIKAYVGTKNFDTYNSVQSVTLRPIDVVPAGTGVVLKSVEGKTYTIPVPEFVVPEEFSNDLVGVAADVDIYDAVKTNYWNEFESGPSLLARKNVTDYDYTTGEYVTIDALGFFPVDKPAAAGTDFIKAGDAYLPIGDGEWDSWTYTFLKLVFTDAEVAAYNNIAELTALPVEPSPDGTPATLNMQYTADVTWTNGSYMAVQDYTGGIFMEVPEGVSVKAGDILSGSFTGKYENVLYPFLFVSPLTDGSTLMVLNGDGAPEPKAVALDAAYEADNIMRYVKISDLSVRVEKGNYGSSDFYLYNADGTEVYLNNAFSAVYDVLQNVEDGDQFEEVVGYAFIVPDDSPYLLYNYDKYEFVPVSMKKKEAAPELLIADFQALPDKTENTLTLKDAQVNHVDEEGIICIQDETGGMVLFVEGLNVKQGDRLNGTLTGMRVLDPLGFVALEQTEATDVSAVEVSAGELAVKEVSISEAKAEENSMRLVMVKGARYANNLYEAGTRTFQGIEKDGEKMMLFDALATGYLDCLGNEVESGDFAGLPIVTSEFDTYGVTEAVLMPIFVPGDVTTGIDGAKVQVQKGELYNLNGVRVNTPQRGVYIQNGRKVVF